MDLNFGGVSVPAGGANAATPEANFGAAPAVYPMQLHDNTSARHAMPIANLNWPLFNGRRMGAWPFD
jgi:hypothetical protein